MILFIILLILSFLVIGIMLLAVIVGKMAHDNHIKLALKDGRIFCNPKDDI